MIGKFKYSKLINIEEFYCKDIRSLGNDHFFHNPITGGSAAVAYLYDRRAKAHPAISCYFEGLDENIFFLTGCRLKIKGKENFKKGENYIITCNHNSLMDVPVSTPFSPGANKTIAKAEMAKIPLFGLIYKRGSILVDRNDKQSRQSSFRKMKEVLRLGLHVCIYPEGTRNQSSLPLKSFHDGAFRLSVESNKAIIPALIFNTKKVLPPGKPFYFMPSKMEIHFLPAVYPDKEEDYENCRNSKTKSSN